MTDEEYIKNISSVSTEELFNSLEYYGYDSYYAVLWRATIEELKKRSEKRPHGHWEYVTHYCRRYRVCSECHAEKEDDRASGWNFCFNCGADMRGGRE